MFEARWRLGSKFMLAGGIGLAHFSNATIRTPNYGLNMVNANIALSYRLSRENPYTRKKLLPELYPFEFDGKRLVELDVGIGFAVKDMQTQLGKGSTFMVCLISANLLKQLSYKSRLGLGLDISYDGSEVKMLEINGDEDFKKYQVIKPGITAAYHLSFSRIAMMFNVGFHLGGVEESDGYLYEKLGLRFAITKNWFASMTLQAHYARADFLAFGAGYKFDIYY